MKGIKENIRPIIFGAIAGGMFAIVLVLLGCAQAGEGTADGEGPSYFYDSVHDVGCFMGWKSISCVQSPRNGRLPAVWEELRP